MCDGGVATAFLHAPVDEPTWIRPPHGMDEGFAWLLSKALYGLRTSPKQFQNWLVEQFSKIGFERCLADPQQFVRRSD
jgi:hypothetical protein